MFDTQPWVEWAQRSTWLPSLAITIYALAVSQAPDGCRSEESIVVKHTFVAWNVAMAVFSAWCTAVAVPHLLSRLVEEGPVSSICSNVDWYSTGAPGAVALTFTLSKFVEFGDTIFLVLRKKQLTVLHTFHHGATLVLTWTLFATRASTGLAFIAMNAFIHMIMYSYYAVVLFPRGRALLAPHSQWITVMQIAQMVVGIAINALAAFEILSRRECDVPPLCVAFAWALYSIYAIMFVYFAVARHAKRKAA